MMSILFLLRAAHTSGHQLSYSLAYNGVRSLRALKHTGTDVVPEGHYNVAVSTRQPTTTRLYRLRSHLCLTALCEQARQAR